MDERETTIIGGSEDGLQVTCYSEACPECGYRYSILADSPEAAAASLFRHMEWHRRKEHTT